MATRGLWDERRVPDADGPMNRRRADGTSFTAGIAIAAFGLLLLLDSLEDIDLRFAYLAPAVTATLGAILLAHGLSRSRGR